MAGTKNLCAQIPTALHAKVCEAREQAGLTTAQYITNLITEYYEMKEHGGNTTMAAGGGTPPARVGMLSPFSRSSVTRASRRR